MDEAAERPGLGAAAEVIEPAKLEPRNPEAPEEKLEVLAVTRAPPPGTPERTAVAEPLRAPERDRKGNAFANDAAQARAETAAATAPAASTPWLPLSASPGCAASVATSTFSIKCCRPFRLARPPELPVPTMNALAPVCRSTAMLATRHETIATTSPARFGICLDIARRTGAPRATALLDVGMARARTHSRKRPRLEAEKKTA
mmetsp:Transcript_154282/g.494781  ORF Transcript_154282/g.494781 Transcript_154282/m.494781 type:complete len:203 (+) Transcript_154282:1001-1609(+)